MANINEVVEVIITRDILVPGQGFNDLLFVTEKVGSIFPGTEVTGTATNASPSATVLEDATLLLIDNELVGLTLTNTEIGDASTSTGTIVSNTATTITVDALTGGTLNQFTSGDTYSFTTAERKVASYTAVSSVTAAYGADSIEENVAKAYFNQNPPPQRLWIAEKISDSSDPTGQSPENYPTALDDIVTNYNNSWYGLAILAAGGGVLANQITHQQETAEWVQDQRAAKNYKLFGISTDDANIYNQSSSADIASVLLADTSRDYESTFVIYNSGATKDDEGTFAEVAWFGTMFAYDPGEATWKFKQLTNVAADDLTTAQFDAIDGKNANAYMPVGGINITREGKLIRQKVGTDLTIDFIDNIRSIDYLVNQMQVNVYTLLVNSPKIAYTNAGITAIESKVKQTLKDLVDEGVLADVPGPTTSVPKVVDVPVEDKTNRILNNVKFTATLAGAIHKVVIEGQISV